MRNLFMKNFWLSLSAYSVVSFLGALCLLLLNVTTSVPDVVTDPPRSTPLWVEVILWLHVLGSAVFYFYFGTRLKLLGNHLINFLSVSGSMALGLILICLGLFFNPYLLIFGMFSFFRFMIFITDKINNIYVTVFILSTLPSIMMWLGMLYQSKKSLKTTVVHLNRHGQTK